MEDNQPSNRDALETVALIPRIQEYRNPLYYIARHLWIRDKAGAIIPFHPNPIQIHYLREKRKALRAGKPPRFLVLKYRRGGITTMEQALSFHLAVTRSGQELATLAHKASSTEKIFRISTLFYDRLREDRKPRRLSTGSKKELNFPDLRSLFYTGTAGAHDFAHGMTLQRFHGSEVSRWPGSTADKVELMSGVTEATSHGEIILETTARGVGDWFHETWQTAKDGAGSWTPIFLAWYMDPLNAIPLDPGERIKLTAAEKPVAKRYGLSPEQIKWRRNKQAELREISPQVDIFPQEYPEDDVTAFLVSGSSFFEIEIIRELIPLCPEPIPAAEWGEDVPPGLRDGLKVWRLPEKGRDYFIGGDVGEGLPGGDASVASVLDDLNRQCATMYGRWRPEVFGDRCVDLAKWYREALLGIEANNHGHSSLNTALNKRRYPRLYRHEDYDRRRRGAFIKKLGWQTTPATRPILLDDLAAFVHGDGMEINDPEFLGECLTFEKNPAGKFEHRKGCHDDRLFSWGIALQLRLRRSGRGMVRRLGSGISDTKKDREKKKAEEITSKSPDGVVRF